MLTVRLILVCLLFGLAHSSCKQTQRKNKKTETEVVRLEINEIVNQIANYKRVDTRGVGIAGVKTEQYERFEKLVKNAKPQELITLTDHASPAVKAYSFWALAKKDFPGLELIVKKHAKDTSAFEFFSGCLLLPERINNFYTSISKDSR